MGFDEFLERVLLWTLPLWLTPYILWYFSRFAARVAWAWVTEPEEPAAI